MNEASNSMIITWKPTP